MRLQKIKMKFIFLFQKKKKTNQETIAWCSIIDLILISFNFFISYTYFISYTVSLRLCKGFWDEKLPRIFYSKKKKKNIEVHKIENLLYNIFLDKLVVDNKTTFQVNKLNKLNFVVSKSFLLLFYFILYFIEYLIKLNLLWN